MITASELAGFFAAHAIWCVSDGDLLIPMLAYSVGDERKMERFVHDDVAEAVALGRKKLVTNDMDADDAALLFDGRIPLDDEKVDAIVIELRCYLAPDAEAVIAVPYTPPTSGKFRVHRPKILAWEHCEDFDLNAAMEQFFKGVNDHQQGAEIWNNSLDESK